MSKTSPVLAPGSSFEGRDYSMAVAVHHLLKGRPKLELGLSQCHHVGDLWIIVAAHMPWPYVFLWRMINSPLLQYNVGLMQGMHLYQQQNSCNRKIKLLILPFPRGKSSPANGIELYNSQELFLVRERSTQTRQGCSESAIWPGSRARGSGTFTLALLLKPGFSLGLWRGRTAPNCCGHWLRAWHRTGTALPETPEDSGLGRWGKNSRFS